MIRNLVLFLLLFAAFAANAQYLESFGTANKGYLIDNIDDLTGVNWSLSPWNIADRDAGDYFNTTAAGKLECVDLDNEICWESPLLNISTAGTVTLAVDLSWTGFDSDVLTNDCILYPGSATLDYIRVMYSINGGAYVMVPNQVGGAACATIGYTGQNPGPHNSNATVNQGGITGTTLKIRICVGTNANAEVVTIDNVTVPQTGVSFGCAAPVLTTAVTPVGCLNPNSGAIDLGVSAGSPPYTYDWSNDGPENPDNDPQDLSALAVGTYTVTVTDAASCSATISATVANNPAITLSTQVLDVTCAGNLDGEIDLVVSGGTGPYTYDWSNDGPENPDNDAQDLVGVGQGTYTVTVTDAVSCTATRSATIGLQPTGAYLEQFNIANKGYLANFVNDFSAVGWTLSAWANQPPAAFGRDSDDFFRTNAGKLEAIDLDQEVCWESPVIDFSGSTMFSVDLAWTGFDVQVDEYINVNYSIDGGSFVQVANVVGGGAGTIQYSTGIDQSGSATVTKNGLSGTTISIQVCGNFNSNAETMTIDNVSVPGSSPYCPAPEPTLVVTQITCNGANNGAIDLSVANGIPPYTYDWSNDGPEMPDNDPQDLSGLAPGTYTVTVTGANSLTATASAMVTQPTALVVTATQINPTNCNVNDGSIDLTVSGGTPSYTYDWSNDGPEMPDNDPQDLNAIPVGTYTVTVTDMKGCTQTSSRTLTYTDNVPPSITCPANATVSANASCQGMVGSYSPASVSDNCTANPTVTQSPAASTMLSGHNAVQTVTLTADDGNSNTASCTFTVTLKDVTGPTITCPANTTVNANASCQGTVGSYSPTSNTDNCNPSPTVTQSPAASTILTGHNAAQTVTLTANDGNGNTSTCSLTVTLKDVTPPTITCPANATVNANASCQGTVGVRSATAVTDNCNLSPTATQSPSSSTIITGHNTVQIVTLTANDGNGNTNTCTMTVTLKDVTPPSLTCPANATINADASCQATLGFYPPASLTDNCNPNSTATQDPLGTTLSGHNTVQMVTLTASDGNGNTSTCTFTVTLKDVTGPTITCPANTTVAANASCQGTVGSYSAATLSDNCNPSPTVTQSPAASTILTGHNTAQTVTLTANDGNGNTSTCSLTVTLKDVTPPSISCPANATVNANASCQGTVGVRTATSLSDNCNPSPIVTQSPAAATILTGHNTVQIVTLTANDGNGNTNTCTMTVTLKDVTPPSLTCPANATINADASCQATLGFYPPASLTDNCNPNSTATQDPVGTTLSGHNTVQTVTLTASDGNGNTSTCTFTVTLKDVTGPTITCPANTTVNANASCQGMVGTYSPATLSDNCNPSPTVTQSPSSGTFLTGHNTVQTVTLTANDGNGNTATCSLTVTLRDVTPPSITCPTNATVNANASCQGSLGSYSPTSNTDNCNPSPTATQSPAAATLLTGHNTVQTVTLTASDGNGNTSSCTLTVTLRDVTPPSISCPTNVTVNADASCQGTIGTRTPLSLSDNCNPSPTVTQSPAASTIISGHNATQTVTLTASDGNGNTSTCTLTVTLKDVTGPTITCPANTTVNANASCQGMVGTYSPATLSDNCNPSPTVTQSPAASTILTGHNAAQTVTLTANDGNGNTSTCSLTVTLKDITPPSVTCPPNATVNANASCQGSLGSYSPTSNTDNCNPSPTFSQSPAAGTLISGHNTVQTVTLTASDGNGNTANCTLSVTLIDNTAPSITCPANVTVAANASCQGTVGTRTPLSLSDNCNPSPTVTQSPAAGTIISGHNATQTVTLTASDGNGNTASCSLVVTLKDVTPPNVTCPGNITINANASCQGTIGSYLPAVVTDNCNPSPTFSQSPAAGTIISGHNTVQTVTLTANDGNGNSQNCTFTVTLRDVTPPSIICRNITANLNAAGTVTILNSDVYQSGSDNCGVVNLQSVTPSTFTCANIGPNTVVLTANDGRGNTSTCSAVVTVRDVTAPVTLCRNFTANIGPSGSVTVPAGAINNGTTDNCSFTLTLTPNTFTCAQIGNQTVVLRATDAGGNSSTCSATVTVRDLSGPTALCKNPTIFLNNVGEATLSVSQVNNGSFDNCGISTISISQTAFNCSELAGSPWPVTLSMTDVNGNSSTCQAYVTVRDAIAPTAICEDVTVQLNSMGRATVYGADLASESTDNCSVWSYSPIARVYYTSNIGDNSLTVTVRDWSGNMATCVSIVTVLPPEPLSGPGGSGTGLDENLANLSLYPNPTTGEFTAAFELSAEETFTLRIFDASGRLIFARQGEGMQGENYLPLQLEDAPSGLYMVDLKCGSRQVQQRLVVQRN
jgi:hypothetical protein